MRSGAERLRKSVRGRDLLARVGEDEFAIVSEGPTAARNAERIAQRFLDTVSDAASEETQSLVASVGIAVYPSDGWKADRLVRGATMAMYRARLDGGNAFYRHYAKRAAA